MIRLKGKSDTQTNENFSPIFSGLSACLSNAKIFAVSKTFSHSMIFDVIETRLLAVFLLDPSDFQNFFPADSFNF